MRGGHPWIRLPAIWMVALAFLAPCVPVRAQQTLNVQDVKVTYEFGRQISFEGRIEASPGIQQASVLFRRSDEEVTRVEPLALEADGMARFTYDASLNLIPPFSTVLFWFQAAFADGSTLTSPAFDFRYDDNRFLWQQASDGPLILHWYEGNPAFGLAALDAARNGTRAINGLLGLELEAPLDIYIYSNTEDLQGALLLGGEEWTDGHADPALGVAMVTIAPGEAQTIGMATAIPHELAHVLLYRSIGADYARLPAWLNEGVASLAEAYPRPDYASALTAAGRSGSLIPFTDLCRSFPSDSGRAFLAYAQSQSFARYLRDTYGTSGLSALIRAYADGLDCEDGAKRGVGVALSQLDLRWREDVLHQNPAGVAVRTLAPYLIVMGLGLLIPLLGAVKMVVEKRRYERRSV